MRCPNNDGFDGLREQAADGADSREKCDIGVMGILQPYMAAALLLTFDTKKA
ncbi:MAG TPA: hypothetical protein VG759_16720 [Candidatus Angelobacter sp.]|jgi:hypothetical protein|nr:hypothetical protein [Candidatus Angelobacter sp.]